MDQLTEQFSDGVDDYWRGIVPDNWENADLRAQSPYLTGWYMVSMEDNQPGWTKDLDGDDLNDERE